MLIGTMSCRTLRSRTRIAALEEATMEIVTNAFSITDNSSKTLGTGLYLGISAQNHSCIPDVFVRFEGATAVMRSPEEGKKYDRSLTISYVDLMGLTEERNKILQDQFCFVCNCSVCTNKVEDDWKRSVNTKCCPGGFCLVDPSDDWNTNPPSCILCKKPVSMCLNKALEYNASGRMELDNKTGSGFTSPAMEFERWCDIFEKFVKVLSPYNTVLVNINQEFLSTAECIGREDICCQYADVVLAAYRRYLPAGHPELSQRLRSAFLSKVQHHPLQQCRMLLLEAYNNAVLSHGENHPIATELASYLS
ncbi:hypothetical protein RB195_023371 [Necator americanus]|uniref:SET domain-containing protein n=1 Tax=Necator americanus TaxID=51031 RepID=A0ABR1EIV7_NECAM